jgi:metal-dependent amidase/aminoacylase/carboxypeptidase family protein
MPRTALSDSAKAEGLLRAAEGLRERLVSLRRQIHAHPEYGFREQETARLIADTLASVGARVRQGVAKTGVIGELGAGAPVVAIRADISAAIRAAAVEVLGEGRVVELPFDTWAEDFGYMTARVPGAMFWLGVVSERVPRPVWHSASFDLDEDALPVGAAVLAASALRLMHRGDD